MFKTGLLLLLGLGIGLWLGFNPQAHRKMLQNWNEAKASYMRVQAQISSKFDDWTAQPGLQRQSTSSAAPKWIRTAWQQLGSIFNTIWSSVQRIWLSLSSNLGLRSNFRMPKK